jgi:hypothetical protein
MKTKPNKLTKRRRKNRIFSQIVVFSSLKEEDNNPSRMLSSSFSQRRLLTANWKEEWTFPREFSCFSSFKTFRVHN